METVYMYTCMWKVENSGSHHFPRTWQLGPQTLEKASTAFSKLERAMVFGVEGVEGSSC